MRRLYGATMVGAVCWMGMLTYLGAFLVEALGLGTGHVGLVYMGAAPGTAWAVWSSAVRWRASARDGWSCSAILAGAVLVALAFSGRVGTAGAVVADRGNVADDGGGRGGHDRGDDGGNPELERGPR